MGMKARKVDATQHDIVSALKAAGCRVWVVNAELDLVVQRLDRTYLLECKTGSNGLTEAQERMKAEGWHYLIVRTPEQALEAVGAIWSPTGFALPLPQVSQAGGSHRSRTQTARNGKRNANSDAKPTRRV
jgi:hypothetical protein